jgi:hypothetical protein
VVKLSAVLHRNGLRTPHAPAMTTTSLPALCLFGCVASITPVSA